MKNSIQPQEIYNIIDHDLYFVDLRDKYQFDNLHIKNFINMPYDQISISSFPRDKTICLICYSGKRTEPLAEHLRQQGYDAYYVEGGFQAFLNLSQTQYF